MQIHGMLALAVVLLVPAASAAKILALMIVPSHSHHLWNSKYLEALAERGHHITYFSVDEYKNPPKNLTQILVKGFYDRLKEDFSEESDMGPYRGILYLAEWEDILAEFVLKSEALQQLNRLIRKEKFDLVVQDVGCGDYLLGAVDVLGRPPVIGITAYGVPPWTLETLGNPMPYSSRPFFYSPYSNTMTLFQRADNYFLHLLSFAVRWFSVRKHDSLSKKFFEESVRPLDQILDDMNIIMVNSNVGFDYPFPMVPGLIPIGGLHVKEPKPLPQDLKRFLDEAKDGVIYFSLGTLVDSSFVGDKAAILAEAFEKLSPIRVLWKWDAFPLSFRKPDNVKVEKWLPQNDILAHPNVRLFFTHSGLLSTQEAVYHGKPIVGMPFFLDQHSNVYVSKNRGLGEKLDFKTLTVDEIVSTIRKVFDDPRYAENARRASLIFRDQMEKPLDRAIYWTEYAIRHKGAPHLRHSARALSWYQNCMLDVLLLTALPFVAAWKLLRFFLSRICNKKSGSEVVRDLRPGDDRFRESSRNLVRAECAGTCCRVQCS